MTGEFRNTVKIQKLSYENKIELYFHHIIYNIFKWHDLGFEIVS